MNKQGRDRLARAATMIDEAKSIIEAVAEEEQEKFDNLSEGLQASERGQKMEEAASTLEDLASTLDDVLSSLGEVQE